MRAALVVVAIGSISCIADVAADVLVGVVDETNDAIVAVSDGIDTIAFDLFVNASVDVGISVGAEAWIGCAECIHSISPSRNAVRSWDKNAGIWKSTLEILG